MSEYGEAAREVINPISASRRGQEALQDLLSGLRDLMLPFYACMDPKKRTTLSTHQAFSAAQQFSETLQAMRNHRELLRKTFIIVKEECDKLPITDPVTLIPYTDCGPPNYDNTPRSDSKSLSDAREHAIKRCLEVTAELKTIQKTLTSALWDVNDLMDSTITKQ
ncbi:hypothetical protein CRM22_007805 [Opisthorchis felineus]|uniref:Mediator of RNA polymerase II transcription subunit 30 n=1 Tax=Opisthorchis felineus TaxID=147828 RepID=A0A4S2LEG1_OPIFE|nr:hypothetical protein CRM22_007805 [Opisthorchis felineus]